MIKSRQILWIIFAALIFCGVFLTVPVYASETDGEYLATIGSGESFSTKDVIYAVYRISPTSIGSYSGWCPGCSSGDCHTYVSGKSVSTTYAVTVDGFSVLDFSSTKAGEGVIDLRAYTGRDSVITMPASYTVKQKISCSGGNYVSGQSSEACGYSAQRSITVSGTLQLYGESKVPEVTSNPVSTQAGTDQSVTFSASGNKVAACRWQKITAAGITDLRDGTMEDGVTYQGCSTLNLVISALRTRVSGSAFRCIMVGERGDEVPTEAAVLTVTDISPPKIKLTYTPTTQTEGEVTIRIQALDPDSGLPERPYHYLQADHAEDSFSVNKNGTYEVIVKDQAGNSAKASVSIENIRIKSNPTPTPSPKPTSSPVPAPTSTPVPQNPIVVPTQIPKPTPLPSSPNIKPDDDPKNENKNTQEENRDRQNTNAQKNVNIKNMTSGYDLQKETEPDTDEETEEVEEEIMLSDAPEEEVVPETVEEDNTIRTTLFICLGVLLLLLLLFFALLFPVRLENADELGNWHFCALKCLRYQKGWTLQVGLLLEDFDSLRLKFGMLFLAIFANQTLIVKTSEGEEIRVDEIKQDLILHYHQVGR